jgi:hypothetical protein
VGSPTIPKEKSPKPEEVALKKIYIRRIGNFLK